MRDSNILGSCTIMNKGDSWEEGNVQTTQTVRLEREH